MIFGERLRELRKQRGMSQRDLAALVGIDYTYVSKVETGDTPPPSLLTIHRIALALAADENELVELANKVSIAAYRARIESLEQDVKALHEALDAVLPIFVLEHGWDYTCVDEGLKALARNRGHLPITMALAEKINERKNNG